MRHGACYVTLHHGPRAVFEAFRAGAYASVADVGFDWVKRRAIRIGSYGDPAAVPVDIWFELASRAMTFTGYTHHWRLPGRFQHLRRILMASVDTPDEAFTARAAGWRTFRTRLADDPILPYESVCPASPEGGQRTTCYDCGQCDGAQPYDLRYGYTAIAHGTGRAAYRRMRLQVID